MSTFAIEQLDRLVEKAQRKLALGDAGGACELAARVLRRQPHHLHARAVHAQSLLGMDRVDEATASLDAAELCAQDDTDAGLRRVRAALLVLRSEALARLGRSDESTVALEQALRHAPSHPRALRQLACACLETGAAERAVRLLKRLLSRRPNSAQAWRLLAQAYEALGCADLALGIYQQLDRQGRVDLGASSERRARRLRIARLHREAHRWAEAAEELNALVPADPHDAALACEAARVAIELGEDVRAMRYLQAALDSRPSHAPARAMLAEQHMRAGRFKQAVWHWWRAAHATDDNGQAWAGLIVAATCADRLDLADRALTRYAESHPVAERRQHLAHMWQSAMPGRLLADLRHNRSTTDRSQLLPALLEDAAEAMEDHLRDHTDHADKHYHLAVCHEALGRVDAASASLDRALRLNNGYVAAARRRAQLLLAESNLAAAQSVVQAVVAARPHASSAMLDLALCIDTMRGDTTVATSRLAREDESSRRRLNAEVRRLLDRYASATAIEQWEVAWQASAEHPSPPFTDAA